MFVWKGFSICPDGIIGLIHEYLNGVNGDVSNSF